MDEEYIYNSSINPAIKRELFRKYTPEVGGIRISKGVYGNLRCFMRGEIINLLTQLSKVKNFQNLTLLHVITNLTCILTFLYVIIAILLILYI